MATYTIPTPVLRDKAVDAYKRFKRAFEPFIALHTGQDAYHVAAILAAIKPTALHRIEHQYEDLSKKATDADLWKDLDKLFLEKEKLLDKITALTNVRQYSKEDLEDFYSRVSPLLDRVFTPEDLTSKDTVLKYFDKLKMAFFI